MRFQWVTFILVLWPALTLQKSYSDSPTYVAGIVEYSPVVSSAKGENLGKLNAENYLKIIEKAITYAVDIIVFPESSLSISWSENATLARSEAASYVPNPADKLAPCDDKANYYAYSITSISCAAREHQIYVLINHREKVDCAPRGEDGCPSDGYLIYNANVVFDRQGRVIARYRKYNLFGEYHTNVTESAVPTTFDTDFGVTFGTFICFDLVFRTPALNLTRDLGVTDVLYPTHWFSELPYLYAVEAQAAWAYANDVNFLASSYNYPDTASGGGGIFLGRQGPVHVVSENKRSNILVVSEIPKVINGKRTQNIDRDKVQIYEFTSNEISTGEETSSEKWLYLGDNLNVYTTESVDVKQSTYSKFLCDRGFCCSFEVNIEFDEANVKNDSSYYHYRFAIFNGTRTYSGVATGGIKTCGIIACQNSNFYSCGRVSYDRTIRPTLFKSVKISTPSIDNENTFFMPITFIQGMVPMNVTHFTFKSVNQGQYSTHRMELTRPVDDLLTFAIYGRDYSKDGSEVTENASATMTISSILLFATAITYTLF